MALQPRHREMKAARIYRYFRRYMPEAKPYPIPIRESNEACDHGLNPNTRGSLWVRPNATRTRFTPIEIVIADHLGWEDKVWVLLHELGHWYCHYPPSGRLMDNHEQGEVEADTFAFMLMRRYGLGNPNEEEFWAVWQVLEDILPEMYVRVTRNVNQFWLDFGRRVKEETE